MSTRASSFAGRGDATRDRRVDAANFAGLLAHFGRRGPSAAAWDFDGGGTVGLEDFRLLLANYGKTLPPPPLPVARRITVRMPLVVARVPVFVGLNRAKARSSSTARRG